MKLLHGMNTSSFSEQIPFSTGWYNGLSDVAILSRLINGENTQNTSDQDAVACYSDIIHKPTGISSQLFFTGLNYFVGAGISANDSPTGLKYSLDGAFVSIKDVIIVFSTYNVLQNPANKDAITNHLDLDSPEERMSHNIFFNLK